MTITVEELKFQKWVASTLRRRVFLGLLGAIGVAVAAVAVLWLSWWLLYGILWLLLQQFDVSRTLISTAAWACFLLQFVVYAAVNWPKNAPEELESPARKRVAKAVAALNDSPFLVLAGPSAQEPLIRIVCAVTLVGPALLVASARVVRLSLNGLRGAPEKVAQILQTLATAGARMPLEELAGIETPEKAAATFSALRLIDGVILRNSEPPGLSVTEGLRNQIISLLPAEKQQPAAAKPPAGRVSSNPPQRAASPAVNPRPKPKT